MAKKTDNSPLYMTIPTWLLKSLMARQKEKGYSSVQELVRVILTQEQASYDDIKEQNQNTNK